MKLSDKLRSYDPHGKLSPSPRFFSDLSETEITGGARALLLSQALIPVLPLFWRRSRPHLSRLFAAVERALRRFWQFLRGKMQKTEKTEK